MKVTKFLPKNHLDLDFEAVKMAMDPKGHRPLILTPDHHKEKHLWATHILDPRLALLWVEMTVF